MRLDGEAGAYQANKCQHYFEGILELLKYQAIIGSHLYFRKITLTACGKRTGERQGCSHGERKDTSAVIQVRWVPSQGWHDLRLLCGGGNCLTSC